ncbi:MAG: PIG-L deacetylase family protein [Terriglobia bacterium]
MDHSTRRDFVKGVGLGAAGLSLPALAAPPDSQTAPPASGVQPQTMPGRPPAAGVGAAGPARVMSIAAHPGDAFFAMGLPIALAVLQGGHGMFLSLSLGEKGSASIPPERYGAMQRDASEHAAREMGAPAAFLAYPDGEIPANDEAAFAVCDQIRSYKPGVVITHWRGSWHKDHRACYKVVNDAIFYAALPALARHAPAHSVGKLFFADNWEDAEGFTADTYLDVAPAFARWLEACAMFPMWRGETGFRYNTYYQSLAAARGCVSDFKYAVALMSPSEQLVRRAHSL